MSDADGGFSGCGGYVACVASLIAGDPDAGIDGSPSGQAMEICNPDSGSTYTAGNVMKGDALLACAGQMCPACQ